jgi:hypothetical protein
LIYLLNYQNGIRIDGNFPPFADFHSNSSRCKPGLCETGRYNAFDGDLNASIWQMLPRLGATHAFINLGWEHIFPFEAQSEFTCSMKEFL